MSELAKKQNRQLSTRFKLLFLLLLAVFFCCCWFLHTMQILTNNSGLPQELETYRSDIKAYVRNTGYSFTGVVLHGINQLTGSALLTALPVALANALTIVALWLLFDYLLPNTGPGKRLAFTWLVGMEAAIWMPYVTYRGLQTLSATLWHSPTFVMMKPFAVLAFLFYLKVQKNYLQRIDWHNWMLFAITLVLSALFKPSYAFCFAPAMAVLLLVDLIRTRGKGLLQIIRFGCAVLPSGLVLLLQYARLFGQPASETSNTIRFGLFRAQLATPLYKHPMFPYAYLLSLVFPILVFWLLWAFREKGHLVQLVFLTFGFALFQDLFMYEDGPRLHHGNMGWAARIAALLLFVLAVQLFARWQERHPWEGMQPLEKRLEIMLWAVLGAHAGCGLLYFVQLLRGVHYY